MTSETGAPKVSLDMAAVGYPSLTHGNHRVGFVLHHGFPLGPSTILRLAE